MKLKGKIFKFFTFSLSSLLFSFPSLSGIANWNNSPSYTPSNLDTTAFYAENTQNGFWGKPKTNIYEKSYNHEPKRITSVDGKIYGYRVSPDRRYLAINQGNQLRYVNTENGVGRSFNSRNSTCGMTYSPDGSHMLAWDQNCNSQFNLNRNKDYYVHNYDLNNNQDNLIYTGQSTSSRFYPYAWRPDNIVIVIEIKNNNEYVWNYDLNNNTFRQTNFKNPYWISNDGRYIAMPQNYSNNRFGGYNHHVYNAYGYENNGYSDSYNRSYQIYDPANANYYGGIGFDNYNNSIVGYNPNQNQIMYQSYKNNRNAANYYVITIDTPNNGTIGETSPDYNTVNPSSAFNEWNNGYIGGNVISRGGNYNIASGNQIITSSRNPIQLIICFAGNDNYENQPNYNLPNPGY